MRASEIEDLEREIDGKGFQVVRWRKRKAHISCLSKSVQREVKIFEMKETSKDSKPNDKFCKSQNKYPSYYAPSYYVEPLVLG